jgi:hypothetical protein
MDLNHLHSLLANYTIAGPQSINKCMNTLCEYGCGQPATYFKFKTPKVPNGRYSCNPSPNSCPTKRAKLKGDLNPSKRLDVRANISSINSVLFASGSALRKKCQSTLLERHGVDNPMAIKEVVNEFVTNRKAKNNYKCKIDNNDPAIKAKRYATNIETGLWTDPLLKTEWQRYEQTVDRLTNQNYKKYKDIINPSNLQRGRTKGTYQLDHIMSKLDGFSNGIDPESIAHPANLRMMSSTENQSKSSKSHYTKEQLFEEIEKFNN